MAVKSAVDLTKIRFNTFLNLYSGQLKLMKLSDDKIQTYLTEAQSIYQKFITTNANVLSAQLAGHLPEFDALPATQTY